ncbi:MAG: SEC-C domain-containing protein, partial [Actinobacteria bacterium]|nr:SEC-C domain-containing protein [Actinomycetota bacterium]
YLQDGIGLRGIAGKDPLVAYQGEAFDMFQSMTDSVKDEFARYILHAKMVEMDMERASLKTVESSGETEGKKPVQRRKDKVGRNDPCPCGSGNKYKKCCGANA